MPLYAAVLQTPHADETGPIRKMVLVDAADETEVLRRVERGQYRDCTCVAIMEYHAHARRLRALLHKRHPLTTPTVVEYRAG